MPVEFFVRDPTAPDAFNDLRRRSMLPDRLQGRCELGFESVDGSRCARIEETRELKEESGSAVTITKRTWLDLALGFMLRRAEVFEGEPAKLTALVITREPEEVLAGLWVPRVCEVTEFAAAAPERLQGRPLLLTRMSLLEWKVNEEVPDTLFEFEFPPGTVVMDGVAATGAARDPTKEAVTYEMPADKAMLDKVINEAIHGVQPRRGWLRGVLAASSVGIVVAALALLARRRRHRLSHRPGG